MNNLLNKLPCICKHQQERHWHQWFPGKITLGEYTCHFIGCSCIKYRSMDNLQYLEYRYNWLSRLWNTYGPNTKKFPED